MLQMMPGCGDRIFMKKDLSVRMGVDIYKTRAYIQPLGIYDFTVFGNGQLFRRTECRDPSLFHQYDTVRNQMVPHN